MLFAQLGQYDRAQPLLQDCLQQLTGILGCDSPTTLEALYNLASVLSSKGDHERALPLHQQCLSRRECALGCEHPTTLQSLGRVADSLFAVGEYHGALQLYQDCLRKRVCVLGEQHADTHHARLSRCDCECKLSLQCCSVVFGFKSAVFVCALRGVRLQPPHVQPCAALALRRASCLALEKCATLEWRRRAIAWGAVGLLCVRLTVAFSLSDRDLTRMAASVASRVVAVRAAARYVA